MELKADRFKDKKFWIKVGGYVLAIAIGFGIGESSASEKIKEEKVKYEEVVQMIEQKQKELSSLEEQLTKLEEKVSEREEEVETVMAMLNDKDKLESDLQELNIEIEEKQNSISDLESKIEEKEQTLASLEGKIRETGEKPIILPAGTFIVGKDLPEGRYSASSNGGSGNFVVYSSGGRLEINQILGDYGVSEHVFFADEGDTIEITIPVKFTPVE